MLQLLCKGRTVKKTRNNVPLNGHIWEIDVFESENAGLIIAEVELQSESENLTIPAWIGTEITGKPEYSNAALARRPYGSWIIENPGAAK
jgi:adenylate cyclase